MTLTPAEMDAFLDQHFEYERNDDVQGVMSTLAPDVTHDVIGWPPGPSHGHEEARAFYETLFADLADGRVTSQWRRYAENLLVDESLWSGRAAGRPFGLEGRNRPLEFRMLHVLEFTDDGKIAKEQVWLDFAAIFAQLSDKEPEKAGADVPAR